MISYNVFFTPKPGVEDQRAIDAAHAFLKQLQSEKRLNGYRIMRVTNPASFQGLPRFQAIIDYASQRELDEALAYMRQPRKKEEGGHGELMEIVGDFRVSFTADV
jgi:hypothetical protein